MKAAKNEQSALDPRAGVAGGLPDDPEKRGVFLRAAVAHAQQQVDVTDGLVERISDKADDIAEQWEAKIDAAAETRRAAVAELAVWQRELDDFEGN